MALRRNKTSGAWERQQPDGSWVEVAPPGAPPPVAQAAANAQVVAASNDRLDALLAETFNTTAELQAAGIPGKVEKPPTRIRAKRNGTTAPPTTQAQVVPPEVVPPASPVSGETDDWDIPGLTSGDGSRGVAGTSKVRDRLLARRGKVQGAIQRPPRVGSTGVVIVGERAARVSGPAVRDTTESRARVRTQQSRRQVGTGSDAEAKGQRYVNRPAPELLQSRPKWVQDLFEAHFRSDLTLQMRRAFNRMKLSRQDYAIGWLTLFDKIREDAAILRLKSEPS